LNGPGFVGVPISPFGTIQSGIVYFWSMEGQNVLHRAGFPVRRGHSPKTERKSLDGRIKPAMYLAMELKRYQRIRQIHCQQSGPIVFTNIRRTNFFTDVLPAYPPATPPATPRQDHHVAAGANASPVPIERRRHDASG